MATAGKTDRAANAHADAPIKIKRFMEVLLPRGKRAQSNVEWALKFPGNCDLVQVLGPIMALNEETVSPEG